MTRSFKANVFRSLVTIICIAVVIGTIFSTTLIVRGAESSLQIGVSRMGADLIVVPKPADPFYISQLIEGHVIHHPYYMDASIMDQLAKVPGVQKLTPQAYAARFDRPFACPCCATFYYYLVGFDPRSDFIIASWLTELPEELGRTDAIIGSNIPATPTASIGSKITVFGEVLEVKGVLEITGTGLDDIIFVTLDSLYRLAAQSQKLAEKEPGHPVLEIEPNQISAVLVRVEPGYSPPDVGTQIKLENILTTTHKVEKYVNVIYPRNLGYEARQRLHSLNRIFLISSSIMWGLSVVLVGAVFSLIVNARRREIGLLRAMGATRRYIFKLITLEVTLPIILAGALGVISGALALYILEDFVASSFDIPYLWPRLLDIGVLAIGSLGLSAITGVLAALYPAISSSRMEPYDAIRRGA